MNQPPTIDPLSIPPQALADAEAARVYRYWFGRRMSAKGGPVDPFADNYRVDHRLWFCDEPGVDAEIKQQFEALVRRAAGGELEDWGGRPREALCLVALLGPMRRRIYRGTPAAHATEDRAVALARSCVERGFLRELAPAESLQIHLALTLSERAEDARLAVEGLAELATRCARPQQRLARAWLNSARKHLDLLGRFGRDPRRNAALGRESTEAERAFLARPTFSGLFGGAKPAAKAPRQEPAPAPIAAPRARILALHGLRQSGEAFRTRARKLRHALVDVADLVFVTAPHRHAGAPAERPFERAWWNASADHADYEGFAESVALLEAVVREQGPFDGVLGFSQGGALAAILAAMQPHPAFAFRFAVCISAFPSRARGHEFHTLPGGVRVPSLHVLGLRDEMVDPERSRRLFEAFDPGSATLLTHPGGHFSPGSWPLDEIRAFVARFVPAAPRAEVATPAVESPPLRALCHEALAADPFDLGYASSLAHEMARQHLWADLRDAAADNAARYTEADVARSDESARVGFHEAIVGEFARQLRADLASVVQAEAGRAGAGDERRRRLLAGLGGAVLAAGPADAWPSRCAAGAPRVGSHTDKACRLARDIAVELFPAEEMLVYLQQVNAAPGAPRAAAEGARRRGPRSLDEASRARRLAYQRYSQLLSLVNGTLAEADPAHSDERNRQLAAAQAYAPEVIARKLARPIDRAITEPEPMPVVPCALEDLAPLFDHLVADAPVERQTAFARGTLTTDGRLDLCKQVVGPDGIGPLLDAMKHSTRVRRLLLGNNIVGDGGAVAIASFLREQEGSPLDCWYLAGNQIGPTGMRHLCEALAHDRRVTSLWLKRNPLRPEGMIPLAEMLRTNPRLEVLDLVNCGLLDEGLETLLGALIGPGRNTTLRHLYAGTNGVTARSAARLAEYLGGDCALESLSISCNRLGDEGLEVIAPALARNRSLRRLSLASNRIGPRGAAALARALAENSSLEMLDLGFTKATLAVGEVGNLLGDEGARAIAHLLTHNRTLLSLDLLHNDISQLGVNLIREALAGNTTLLSLQLTQFGRAHNEAGREEIRAALARNRARSPAQASRLARLELPDHVAEIYSVYRTHM
jgi:uncharacterized protein (DUF924 family)/Ran GTPase-activating protein (RanGAP) involved in mRNA processing and transport/predicted esterase